MKVAKQRKSAVLESNAIHHRVDSLTGIVALATIAASNLYPALSSLDAVGGLLISWMVIRAGWGNTKIALTELADASISQEIKDKANAVADAAVREATSNGSHVRDVSGTKAGQNYLLDIEVIVPGDQTIEQLNKAETLIRERVGANVRGARRIRVRFVAADVEGTDLLNEFVPPSLSSMAKPEDDGHEHNHHDGHGNGHIKKDK